MYGTSYARLMTRTRRRIAFTTSSRTSSAMSSDLWRTSAWRFMRFETSAAGTSCYVDERDSCAMRFTVCLALLVFITVMQPVYSSAQVPSSTLQPPSAFSSIADPAERSRAIFAEAAKVLTHPRCLNCHPMGDRPTQANDVHPHEPFTRRDLPCVTCPHRPERYVARRRILSEHSRPSALDDGTNRDGVAGQVDRRYLQTDQGS